MTDYDAPADSGFNAGRASARNARKRPVEASADAIQINCIDTPIPRAIDEPHPISSFFFLQQFPGTYRLQLNNVEGFNPYIYVDVSTNNLPGGGNVLDVPFVGGNALISAFVAAVSGGPDGEFDLQLICPTPDLLTVHVNPTHLAIINANFGANLTGELTYVHDTTYYEENTGTSTLHLEFNLGVGQWSVTASGPLGSGNTLFAVPDSSSPVGVYPDNSIGTDVEITV